MRRQSGTGSMVDGYSFDLRRHFLNPLYLNPPCVRTWCLGFFVLLATCAGCSRPESPDASSSAAGKAGSAPAAPPALVQVQSAEKRVIRPKVLAVGTVRARHTSVVASGADGIVEEYSIEQGQFVVEGQVLSQLRMKSTNLDLEAEEALLAEREAEYLEILSPRKEDVDEAQARLQAAQISLTNAKRQLDELKALGQRGAANSSAVQDAEDRFEEESQLLLAARAVFQRVSVGVREEQKLQAKARRDAQQKRVEFLKSEREKRITQAPFDGFVVEEHSYDGEWLSKGAPVATLAQLSEVDVEVQLDQSFVSQVNRDDEVQVQVAGAINPDTGTQMWPGVINAIVLRSDWEEGSRSFPVIVRVSNRVAQREVRNEDKVSHIDLPILRDGMMAEVHFAGDPVDALLVPKDALVRSNRGIFVFAVDPVADGGQPVAREIVVEPGISDAGWIQVTCQGLEPGTPVVAVGGERLRPFQSVLIQQKDAVEKEGQR